MTSSGAAGQRSGADALLATGRIAELAPDVLRLLMERGADAGAIARDVGDIERMVRERGDDALRELTHKYDNVELGDLEVPRSRWIEALARVPRDVREALEAAHENIRKFHRACLPVPIETQVLSGVRAGRRIVPLGRVGVYVPGGRAAYPSTVLMTVTPAKVAGVREVVVVTPPGRTELPSDATLAACAIAGADRVFAVGGAQAIFALAQGTRSLPRVDKIVGPGNAYVAAAKAAVAGRVAIDSPAGPSEVLVLCDERADAKLAALEMLAQAEHDPRAACVAVSTDPGVAERIRAELAARLGRIERSEIVSASLRSRGAVLVASDEAEMLSFAERWAPEHLVVLTRDPRASLAKLTTYGSAFLGPHSTVAFGDYCSGPNHVLPTGGLARSYSGLSVEDFLRRPTHQEITPEGFARLAPIAETLAGFEGLPNHATAVRERRTSR